MKTNFAIGLLLCAETAALGHDMYIVPDAFRLKSGATVSVGFHVGDSFPNSEVSGRLEKLENPRLLWRGGSAPLRNLRIEGKRDRGDVAVGGSGDLIAAVNTKTTLITLEPAKFLAYLKSEGLTDVIAWRAKHGEASKAGKERYSKYAKSLLVAGGPNDFSSHAVGFPVEIIPEANPYQLKAGDVLPIRVLFRRKPAADLQIEAAYARPGAAAGKRTIVGRTDSEGRLKVKLPSSGLWRIHTIKMERCAEPSVADWESFWASFTFELP